MNHRIYDATQDIQAAETAFALAATYWSQPDLHNCVMQVIGGCWLLVDVFDSVVRNVTPDSCMNMISDLATALDTDFTEISESLPVTYKTIAEAWGKDDFQGAMVTIAFIDRMRQLLWDQPYFVAWAAIPEQQIEGP